MTDAPRLLGGRYEVGALVGRGGMAEVHLGHDTRLGRTVAIKMLRSDLARDTNFITRFRREAQSAAGLNHASIVAVYDSGGAYHVESGGAEVDVPYIVMEYVDGRTLRDILNERGTLSPQESAQIVEGVLDALAYSHRMGIVHRDIKPANVMISRDGAVKVMDFGIARAIADANATMTQTQAVIGTAQYLSPEQAQGQNVDERSDLYSTGCMLFELLTGRPPFVGDTPIAIAYQHVGQAPVPPSTLVPGISRDLDAVVLHSLAKARDARYQDAASFRNDLVNVRLGRPVSAAAHGTASGSSAGVGAVAAGAAAAGVGAAATQQLSALGAEPTEVYAVGGLPPNHDPSLARRGNGDTSSFPAIGGEEERSKRSASAYALLTIAVVLALGLLGFGLKSYFDARSAQAAKVSVPDVVGKPQATAVALLAKADLVAKIVPEASDTVPAEEVIDQNPEPASSVDRGSEVTLKVSTGPDAVVVPDLKGRTESEARALLSDLKLEVGKVTPKDDSELDAGLVISSTPGANESIAPGGKVDLEISSGKVTVPPVVGMSVDAAIAALKSAGLKAEVSYEKTDAAPEGQVIKQDPKGDTKSVEADSTVKIVVSQSAPASSPAPTDTPTILPPSPTSSATPTA